MMFEVNLDKTKLGISFMHDKPQSALREPYCRTTKCILYGLTSNQAIKLAEGVSRCSWLDNFRKATGRKLALSAMKGLTREDRQKVWEVYLNRPRNQPKLPTAQRDVSGNVMEGP